MIEDTKFILSQKPGSFVGSVASIVGQVERYWVVCRKFTAP